jgi:hypothetical protein
MFISQKLPNSTHVNESAMKRRGWDSDFNSNLATTAQTMAHQIARSILKPTRAVRDAIEITPYFPYEPPFVYLMSSRFRLKMKNVEDVSALVILFDSFLPQKNRLAPFSEWIPGIAAQQAFERRYFGNKFKILFATVNRELEYTFVRDAERYGVNLADMFHKLKWSGPRAHRELHIITRVLPNVQTAPTRELWTTHYKNNRDAMAHRLAERLILRMNQILNRRQRDPFLAEPNVTQENVLDISLEGMLKIMGRFIPENKRLEPFAQWIKELKDHVPEKHDTRFFDPILKDFFKRVANEVSRVAKADGNLKYNGCISGKNFFLAFARKI